MKCPVCDVQLSISSREGVEIDYCGQCRGVWLDRGELDKILERAASSMAPDAVGAAGGGGRRRDDWSERRYERDRDDRHDRDDRYYDNDYDDRRYGHKRRKRRGSFLDDLFDFD